MANFVEFKLRATANIDNSGAIVFQSEKACILDSIWLSNTTEENIFVDFKIIIERLVDNETQTIESSHTKNRILEDFKNEELLKGSVLYMQANDIMYANSDFSSHVFDCNISYREIL